MKRRLIGRLPFLSGILIAHEGPGLTALWNRRLDETPDEKLLAERNRTLISTPKNTD
jgi:hypothetical protein